MTSLPENIATGDLKSRLAALSDAIGADDEPGLKEAITAALEEREPRLRRAALETIALTSDAKTLLFPPSVAPKILAMAHDLAIGVRAETAVALATVPAISRDDATLALLRLLRDDAMEVRQEAAAALGDVADERAREPLATVLESDKNPGVRFEAAFALASLKDARALPLLVEMLGGPRFTDACEALKRLGDARAIDPLRAHAARFFLGWPEKMVAHAAMYVLGAQDEGRNYLVSKLGVRNRGERELAIATLGHLRIAEAREALEAIARDGRDRARGPAVTALGNIGDPRSIPVLETITDASLAEDVAAALASLK